MKFSYLLTVYYLFKKQAKPIDYAASGNLQIPLANGNIMKIPLKSINITEEVNKTGLWKQVNDHNISEKEKNNKINR